MKRTYIISLNLVRQLLIRQHLVRKLLVKKLLVKKHLVKKLRMLYFIGYIAFNYLRSHLLVHSNIIVSFNFKESR